MHSDGSHAKANNFSPALDRLSAFNATQRVDNEADRYRRFNAFERPMVSSIAFVIRRRAKLQLKHGITFSIFPCLCTGQQVLMRPVIPRANADFAASSSFTANSPGMTLHPGAEFGTVGS